MKATNQLSSLVKGVSFYAPEQVVTNHDLSKVMDTSDEWIFERSGIKERRHATTADCTSDFGVFAAQKVLQKTGTDAKDLDLIIATTLSPDYFFPGIGVLIQNKLAAQHIPAIDLRAQCSGFSWGMATADAYIRSGLYKRVLVVGAELQSRVVEFSDRGRSVAVLFGDGAGAMILEAQSHEEGIPAASNKVRGVIDHLMGSDGAGAELLMMKRPGFMKGEKEFFSVKDAQEKSYLPYMDGKQVFKHAVTRMVDTAQQLLARHNLTAQDLDLVVPHQANIRINDAVREKLGLSPDKVFNNIDRYGNTTSATIPIAMSEAEEAGKLKKGGLLMTLAFGAGFTWGANLIRW